jgi:hypothetical protein
MVDPHEIGLPERPSVSALLRSSPALLSMPELDRAVTSMRLTKGQCCRWKREECQDLPANSGLFDWSALQLLHGVQDRGDRLL